MVSDVIIRAEGLGKKYIIGHQSERDRGVTFRDMITRSMRNWGRSAQDMMRGRAIVAGDETEEFWALKDVKFEIRRGDVVGIIGRNGAGKSTLLKILSRITEPSEGRVTIDGRVASLLEVGTGFHAELSGRENIYLNGAILGMTRAEIKKKFDEIVDFAGVGKFLDTPVKRYSSGMYVRLAFAVAAHLEPEILIVDEVLAVGDDEFQKRCIGRMNQVAKAGRTVLFVSHNLHAVRTLCTRGIMLSNGHASLIGDVTAVIDQYRSMLRVDTPSAEVNTQDCTLKIERLDTVTIGVSGNSAYSEDANFVIGVDVYTLLGTFVMETGSTDSRETVRPSDRSFAYTIKLPRDLRPGEYVITAYCYLHNERWLIDRPAGPSVRLEISDKQEAGKLYYERTAGYGPVITWERSDPTSR